MFQDMTIEQLAEQRKKEEIILIDVRSPSEFEQASIPGSINIPLFDDQERAEIGTLYKQVSIEAAKERGLEVVSAKLPDFVRHFAAIKEKKAVFCWRGGMRSRTTATLLSLMDVHVTRLTGGYRAYRQWVVESLEGLKLDLPFYVIHGHTGNGKTAILRKLKGKGYPVLDLEKLAGHRGSVFGGIGLRSHNQKTFDALLLEELLQVQDAPYLLLEAESKRIGKVVIPDIIMGKKERGIHIRIELPMEARVNNILEDYRPQDDPEACMEAFSKIESRIHTPIASEIKKCLQEGIYDRAVERLLIHYYDPRYTYSDEQYEAAEFMMVKAQTVDKATDTVEQLLKQKENRRQK